MMRLIMCMLVVVSALVLTGCAMEHRALEHDEVHDHRGAYVEGGWGWYGEVRPAQR